MNIRKKLDYVCFMEFVNYVMAVCKIKEENSTFFYTLIFSSQ